MKQQQNRLGLSDVDLVEIHIGEMPYWYLEAMGDDEFLEEEIGLFVSVFWPLAEVEIVYHYSGDDRAELFGAVTAGQEQIAVLNIDLSQLWDMVKERVYDENR